MSVLLHSRGVDDAAARLGNRRPEKAFVGRVQKQHPQFRLTRLLPIALRPCISRIVAGTTIDDQVVETASGGLRPGKRPAERKPGILNWHWAFMLQVHNMMAKGEKLAETGFPKWHRIPAR